MGYTDRMRTPLVGDFSCYPFDQPTKWEHVTSLPSSVAWQWVKEFIEPEIESGLGWNGEQTDYKYGTYDLREEFYEGRFMGRHWLNKLYIVVQPERQFSPNMLAIYNHDGTYWLIRFKGER